MTDIVKRLRDQGKDAFHQKYSLGMFKLCAEGADEIERLRKALMPFARYFDLNDCDERRDDDALEVPIGDLRRARAALRIVGVPSRLSEGES